jgi:nucleoid-associated protein YgaU
LDSATELDSAADLDSAPPMPKAATDDEELDEIDLEDDTQQAQAAPTATPQPEAGQTKSELEDELQLDEPMEEPAPEQKVADPVQPTTPVDDSISLEPEEPQPIVEEPSIEPAPVTEPEPPPAIAKQEPERSDLFDPPNEAFEKRLHQIVESVSPVDDYSWEEVIGERRAELYPVQAGDTLWDISKTFFGDGFFWGKLWSQNGTIENPHDISKGYALRFVAGTESEAPAVGVTKVVEAKTVGNGLFDRASGGDKPVYREEVEGEITQDDIDSGIAEMQEIIPAPTLPPPSKRIPLLKVLPGSFKAEKVDAVDEGYDTSGIKGAPSIRAREAANVILRSYAVDREPDNIGKVDEIEAQDRFAAAGQYVIVRLNRDVNVGTRITFIGLRPRPSGAPGPIVDVQGVGTITGVVNENKNAYRALVSTMLAPVEKGAIVLSEPPPKVVLTNNGRRAEADVKVLGAEFDNTRRVIGIGSVIYLSGGAKAGLRAGDILGIESKREARLADTRYPDVRTPIASVKVADVREKVATAVVLENGEYIAIGDRTSGEMPVMRPPLVTETTDEATNFSGGRNSEVQ